jgi:pyrroloquinoline quinone (PQQ) biosynthesis protein C
MEIRVPISDESYLAPVDDWEGVVRAVAERRPRLEALARRAFVEGDRASWEEAQRLLYRFNIEDLERRGAVTDPTRLLRQVLRNTLIELEEAATKPPPRLACLDRFTSEAAIQELYDIAKAHRINAHPLLQHMSKSGLRKEALRAFLENYYVNNRVFHLHIAALSLSSPLALRGEMYRNLNDELGHAIMDRAHPVIFLRNFNSIGRPAVIEPTAESLHLLNSKVYACFLCGDFRVGVGGMGFLELAMPAQMQQIHEGLRRSGLPEEDLEFWPLHVTIDERHGEDWFQHMREVIETPEHAIAVLKGGLRVLEARAGFYDGVWSLISDRAARREPASAALGAQ